MRDKTKYNAYINSPEWQIKRKEVFNAKWYKCEACWISESLHIHHWTYRRLYKEEISDLFVLCWYCHMSLHDKYGTRDLFRATKAFIKWNDLIPRKSKSKVRGKSKKVKQITNTLVYGVFRLQRGITITRVQMIISRKFKEKQYKKFIQGWKRTNREVTIT